MQPFDQAWILLKQQGRVRRGFGDSPFPKGKTPIQELDQQRRLQMSRGGAKPQTLRTSSVQELERDNVLDPSTGQMIPDFVNDFPNPAAGPVATIGTSYDELQRVYAKLMSGEVLTPEEEMALQQAERQPL